MVMSYPDCRKVKGLFLHEMEFKVHDSGGCPLWKKMWHLLQFQHFACKDGPCNVPACSIRGTSFSASYWKWRRRGLYEPLLTSVVVSVKDVVIKWLIQVNIIVDQLSMFSGAGKEDVGNSDLDKVICIWDMRRGATILSTTILPVA
uniref:histone acetyltransferase n=1 Tax=Tanacetum cinerariifolium TaxID=118510 RepID=A0A6L2MR08_TANCI|nr:histone acetyltransferase HAC1-like isoform X1 [Tanacetum cinerariifolium]